MKSYTLIIISALTLGITSVLYKKSTTEMGPVNTTFYYYLFGTIISFVVWVLFRSSEKVLVKDLVYPGLIAIFLFISILTFNIGLQKTKVSISATIRAFSFIFSTIIAVLIFKEEVSPKQVIGIVLAGISLFLMVS